MVQLDTRLPLMVQQPDIVNALDMGTRAAANQASVMRQAEGQNLFRQYGAGAMQGDPSALAQLAGFDPVMAQGMDFNRQENARADARLAISQEQLAMAKAETARAVREAQDKAAAENQVKMLERAFREMDIGMRTGDMRVVSQGLRMFGLEELSDDPETAMQLAAQMVSGGIEGLASAYLPKPTEYAVANGAYYDKNNPGAGATPIPGMPASQPLVDMSGMVIGGESGALPGNVPLANANPPAGAQEAFGLEGFLKGGANTITDFIGLGEVFPNAAEQARFFRNLEEDMLVGLSQAYGRQPAQQLMERLRSLLPNSGTIEGANRAFGELVQMENRFRSDLLTAEQQLSANPRMNQSDRQQLRSRIDGLRGTLARVEEARKRFQPAAPEISQDDADLINKWLNQ